MVAQRRATTVSRETDQVVSRETDQFVSRETNRLQAAGVAQVVDLIWVDRRNGFV
ncbi:MAG: hypothetical protein ACLQU1_19490 [Bryobacteraceae bacterium]